MLSRDYLLKRVDGEGLFQTYPECKDFIIEALKFHLANGQSALATSSHNPGIKEQGIAAAGSSSGNNDLTTSQFTTPRTRPRQPIGKQYALKAKDQFVLNTNWLLPDRILPPFNY